jgi:hypothetical protein
LPSSPLNIFQHVTRQWDALHPYNAAQLMQLSGPADVPRIESTWRETLREMGLGQAHVSRGRYFYTPPTDDLSRINVIPPTQSLNDFITAEMNRHFTPHELPFRPFVLSQEQSHFLGVIYHHWIADSVSIRGLLREWFFRLYDPARATREPFKQPTSGYWRFFGPDAGNWDLMGNALGVFRWSSRLKRVRRVENQSFPDLQTQFRLHRLPDGLAEQLLPIARSAGATLNDLFLAAMAIACDQFVAAPPTPKRPDLALGVIVDLRGTKGAELENVFGLFLGFTNVLCGPEHLNDWNGLVTHLAKQNRTNRQTAAAQSSMLRMLGGRVLGNLMSRKRLIEFYRKRLPLAAGISNVNLNRTWVAEYHPAPILDYIRVSPTGPMLPVVFTPCTLGNRMHFGLTHRVSILPDDRAAQCAAEFARRLTSIANI